MADQGAIGTTYPPVQRHILDVWAAGSGSHVPLNLTLGRLARPLAIWAEDYRGLINIPVTGVISGTVKENGVAKPYAWVAIYYRKNGQYISRTRASEAGVFSFSGLEPGVDEYYVVALDDGFNALIYDRIEAI